MVQSGGNIPNRPGDRQSQIKLLHLQRQFCLWFSGRIKEGSSLPMTLTSIGVSGLPCHYSREKEIDIESNFKEENVILLQSKGKCISFHVPF